MRDNNLKVAGAFLAGGLIGAAVALLYAPKSGYETRNDIARSARRIKKSAIDLAEETIENINNLAEDVKDLASDLIESGVDMTEHAKDEIIKSFEHGHKTIEKQKKRVMAALGI